MSSSTDLQTKIQIFEYVKEATEDFSNYPEESKAAILAIKQNGVLAQEQLASVHPNTESKYLSHHFISLSQSKKPHQRPNSPVNHQDMIENIAALRESLEKAIESNQSSQPGSSSYPNQEHQRTMFPVEQIEELEETDAEFERALVLSLEELNDPVRLPRPSADLSDQTNLDSYNANLSEEEAFNLAIRASLQETCKDSDLQLIDDPPKIIKAKGKEKFVESF